MKHTNEPQFILLRKIVFKDIESKQKHTQQLHFKDFLSCRKIIPFKIQHIKIILNLFII